MFALRDMCALVCVRADNKRGATGEHEASKRSRANAHAEDENAMPVDEAQSAQQQQQDQQQQQQPDDPTQTKAFELKISKVRDDVDRISVHVKNIKDMADEVRVVWCVCACVRHVCDIDRSATAATRRATTPSASRRSSSRCAVMRTHVVLMRACAHRRWRTPKVSCAICSCSTR
jgi:hypothetical protein